MGDADGVPLPHLAVHELHRAAEFPAIAEPSCVAAGNGSFARKRYRESGIVPRSSTCGWAPRETEGNN